MAREKRIRFRIGDTVTIDKYKAVYCPYEGFSEKYSQKILHDFSKQEAVVVDIVKQTYVDTFDNKSGKRTYALVKCINEVGFDQLYVCYAVHLKRIKRRPTLVINWRKRDGEPRIYIPRLLEKRKTSNIPRKPKYTRIVKKLRVPVKVDLESKLDATHFK